MWSTHNSGLSPGVFCAEQLAQSDFPGLLLVHVTKLDEQRKPGPEGPGGGAPPRTHSDQLLLHEGVGGPDRPIRTADSGTSA